jgi:hypothetical protein
VLIMILDCEENYEESQKFTEKLSYIKTNNSWSCSKSAQDSRESIGSTSLDFSATEWG